MQQTASTFILAALLAGFVGTATATPASAPSQVAQAANTGGNPQGDSNVMPGNKQGATQEASDSGDKKTMKHKRKKKKSDGTMDGNGGKATPDQNQPPSGK